MEKYHVPVLLNESIEGLQIKPDGTYVDCTFGGGGHSKEILKHLTTGKLIAFDQDADAIKNKPDNKNLIMVQGNFRFMRNYLRYFYINKVNGILADLGVSSHHFDDKERGFSFRFNSSLDMRMNKSGEVTAQNILNNYDTEKLKYLFKNYGELKNAGRIAGFIDRYRKVNKIETVNQLKELLNPIMPKHGQSKFLAKIFQALRIEVNDEMLALKEMLMQTKDLLNPGGRLVVITYHSLEDRLVKNFIKKGMFAGEPENDLYGNVKVPFTQINRKVIIPDNDEIEKNSRARSAKLRIAEKI